MPSHILLSLLVVHTFLSSNIHAIPISNVAHLWFFTTSAIYQFYKQLFVFGISSICFEISCVTVRNVRQDTVRRTSVLGRQDSALFRKKWGPPVTAACLRQTIAQNECRRTTCFYIYNVWCPFVSFCQVTWKEILVRKFHGVNSQRAKLMGFWLWRFTSHS